MDDTPTTLPLVFKISGSAYLVQYTVPQKLTSITFFSTSISASLNSARIEMPALFTMISIFPKVVIVCFIKSAHSSSTVTSHWMAIALIAYCFSMDCAISHRVTYWRAAKTRLQPRLASSNARDFPIPEDAPVIIATLLFNFIDMTNNLIVYFYTKCKHVESLNYIYFVYSFEMLFV